MAVIEYSTIELVTTVDLAYTGKDTKIPVYHLVYASQLYQTVFAIYGNFKIIPSADGNSCEVKSISFKLLNYKGIVNIGFMADPIEYEEPSIGERYIKFRVQGANTTLEKEFTFPTPIKVNKGSREKLSFNRILHQLPSSLYNPGPGPTVPGPKIPRAPQPPQSILFDMEFQHRDGLDYYDNELREGMDGWTAPPPLGNGLIASGRCYQSNVNLLY